MEREVMGLAEFASHGRDPCNRLTPHSIPPRRAAIRRPQLLHRCTIAQARACARTLAAELSHAGLGSLHSVTINFLHILKFALPLSVVVQWDSGFKKKKRLERSLPASKILPFRGSQPAPISYKATVSGGAPAGFS